MNQTGIKQEKDNQDSDGQDISFVLTDHGHVVASKETAPPEPPGKNTDSPALVSANKKLGSPATNLLERIRRDIEEEVKTVEVSDLPLGVKLVLIARAYGRDPEQWLPGDKVSNLLVEAVLYSAGLNLPWGFDAVPDYAELKYILGQDKRFDRVFRVDKLRPHESARNFESCSFQDGDLAIWASNGRRLSCFLEKAESEDSQRSAYNVLCAGCVDSPTGFLYTTLDFYLQSYAQANVIPDVVFRATRTI